MISLVLYGRNDSYGYNLHKRAALSLNCMAEILTDPDDEILFVDYNTPDDFPTFPEAIEDTLTEKAKRKLRIFRVRPSFHARYAGRTHLKALEPVSRNIAARRSNPTNRWILSTNTDMIFVPQSGTSLTELVRDLDSGYWAIPRFEIPESLWESFDRKDPVSVIKTIDYWGRASHLNEKVMGADENLYDAPGDFQLIERDVFFRINGFDERMLLGWHVDSNIAKRLFLINGQVRDLSEKLYGYHCDHTRQITPAHRHNSVENDLDVFCNQIITPKIDQPDWGCPNDEIEEVQFGRNNTSRLYSDSLQRAIRSGQKSPTVSLYRPEGYDRIDYDPEHVVAFLSDLFVNVPRNLNLAWVGFRKKTLDLFVEVWISLGFTGKILIDFSMAPGLIGTGPDQSLIAVREKDDLLNLAQAFVVDFGIFREAFFDQVEEADERSFNEKSKMLIEWFFEIARIESERVESKKGELRRIVTLNAFHNRFESMVRGLVGTARTPFSTRIQQGFLLPPFKEEELLPKMHLGPLSRREEDKIIVAPVPGFSVHGPYLVLLSGRYRIRCRVELDEDGKTVAEETRSYLEVAKCYSITRQERVDITYFPFWSGKTTEISMTFDVFGVSVDDSGDPATYEFRLWNDGKSSLKILSMRLEKIGNPGLDPAFIGENLLPKMTLGDISRRKGDHVKVLPKEGCSIYGPYLRLPSGRYRLELGFELNLSLRDRLLIVLKKIYLDKIYLEVVTSQSPERQARIASMDVFLRDYKKEKISLDFDVPNEWGNGPARSMPYEFRLWTNGRIPMELRSLTLSRK